GSPWATGVEVAIVAEQLARGAADTAFAGPMLAADLRRRAGAPGAAATETVAFNADLSQPARAIDGALAATSIVVDAAEAAHAVVLTEDRRLAQVSLDDVAVGTDLTRRMATLAAGTSAAPLADQRGLAPDALMQWTALGLAVSSADLVGTMRG